MQCFSDEPVADIEGHAPYRVSRLAYHPSGRFLATCWWAYCLLYTVRRVRYTPVTYCEIMGTKCCGLTTLDMFGHMQYY